MYMCGAFFMHTHFTSQFNSESFYNNGLNVCDTEKNLSSSSHFYQVSFIV